MYLSLKVRGQDTYNGSTHNAKRKGQNEKIENSNGSISKAVRIDPDKFEEFLHSLQEENHNVTRIMTLRDFKTQYLFTSEQLITLLKTTPSFKTRLAFVKEIGPRLVDPKAKPSQILELFRYAGEKRQAEEVLRARDLTITKQSSFSICRKTGGGRGGRGKGSRDRVAYSTPLSPVPRSKENGCIHLHVHSSEQDEDMTHNQRNSPHLQKSQTSAFSVLKRPSDDEDCVNTSGYGSTLNEQVLNDYPLATTRKRSLMDDVGSVANIMSIILTCNMFSFPWSFFQTGICYGILILVFSAVISSMTALTLIRSQRQLFYKTGNIANYSELCCYYLGGGHTLSSSIQISTAISCFGGCIGFYIFMGQILAQLLSVSLGIANLLLLIPLVPLSLSRSFKDLSIFTIISVGSFIMVIAIIYQYAFSVWNTAENDSHRFHLPKNDNFYHTPDITVVIELIGNATFLYAIHYCLLSQGAEDIEDEMNMIAVNESTSLLVSECKNESKFRPDFTADRNISISFLISTCVCIIVGATGHMFAKNGEIVRYDCTILSRLHCP